MLKLIITATTLMTPIVIMYWRQRFARAVPAWVLFLLCVFGFWLMVQLGTAAINYQLQAQLDAFDLDGNGLFTPDEQNTQQQAALDAVAHDTARTFAPITGGIAAVFYVSALCVLYKIYQLIRILIAKKCLKNKNRPI